VNISIECLPHASADASQVRQEVFGGEWQITLPRLDEYSEERQLTLVARDNREPVAALTVLETTGDRELHGRLGLSFPDGQRVARYTQLAVLKPYRGRNLPLRLVLEGRRRFCGPMRIHYAWLLFDAERANHSSFCNLLGFSASRRSFLTDYGYTRVLTRDETSSRAEISDRECRSWFGEDEEDRLVSGLGVHYSGTTGTGSTVAIPACPGRWV
jgi:hypothetical protein